MIGRVRNLLGRRSAILMAAFLLTVPLAVAAYASAHQSPRSQKVSIRASESTENQTEPTENEPSSESTARFLGDEGTPCNWPDGVSAPSGNWSHGDFVSAWAKFSAQKHDESTGQTVRDVAHSDCGKPLSSLGHENGGENHGRSAEAKAAHKP